MNCKRFVSAPPFASLLLACLLSLLAFSVSAQDNGYTAISTADPEIDVKELHFLLIPLTQAELEIEANAWQTVLASKVTELSKLEILSQRLGAKAELLDDAASELSELAEATQSGDAEAIAEAKAELQETGEDLDVPQARIQQITESANQAMAAQALEKSEQYANEKSTLAMEIAKSRIDQGGLVRQFQLVLDALESKGGDVTEMRLYADAVSGIEIDVSDTGTAFLAVREWVKSEDGGALLLINIITFIGAIFIVVLISKLAGRIADKLTSAESVSLLLENFIKVAARRTVLVIGILMSLPIIGINIGPVLAVIGAAGLVVGLALQGTLSNFASGVLILIYRPYDMNDFIEVGGITGNVCSMTLVCTTLKTLDNKLITVPNNNVWNDTITNYTGVKVRRIDLVFGIAYGDDFNKAKAIMDKILDDHPKILSKPEPNVRVHELGDSSVNLVCRPWVKTEDYWNVHWDVIETVKTEFDAQGISIPFPQRDVHFFPAADLSIKQQS